METVPENWFQEYTIIPNEIFSLNPVTKFQKKKSLPEIVFLPTEKLGLILGKKHRTLLDIRTLTNTELKMGETEGLMTKFELWGKEENKQKAKVMLAEVMHHIPPLQPGEITKTFKLPQKLIGILIGPNGSMIKSIQSKTWCFVKVFKNSKCMLRGLPDRVEKAEYVIRKLLGIHKFISKKQSKNLENLKNYEKKQFMEIMNNKCINLFIPSKLITRVINSNIDTLETEFNVSIGLAKEINKEITRITIKGQIGGIKACKMRFDRVLGIKLKKKLNEKKLPLGWCYFNDLNTKQPYYYNRKKNIVTWNHPMSEKYKKEYENRLKKKNLYTVNKKIKTSYFGLKLKKIQEPVQIISVIGADGKIIVYKKNKKNIRPINQQFKEATSFKSKLFPNLHFPLKKKKKECLKKINLVSKINLKLEKKTGLNKKNITVEEESLICLLGDYRRFKLKQKKITCFRDEIK